MSAVQLAATLADLFRQSRTDGRNRATTLSQGLKVTVSTYPDEYIALSREAGVPSMDEAAIVAREAGWLWFSTDWQRHGGQQYLVIRIEYPPDDADLDSAPAPSPNPLADPSEPPGDGGPPTEFIQALLQHPGPWRKDALTLRGDLTSYLAHARRCQLLDMYDWIRGKYPEEYRAFQQRHLHHALF